MVPSGLDSNGAEEQQAGRKRQRQNGNPEEISGAQRPVSRNLGLSRLRRPGHLQRDTHVVQESEAAKHISRESRFMDGLPLKAPYIPEEVCEGCGKTECECEPESDSEDMDEEPPKNWRQRTASAIRQRTDVVRDYSGRIVNDQGFQIFIVMLILGNSLFIGVSTFDFVEESPEAYQAFRVLDLAFLIIFTIELIMQFLYHGYNLFFDGWLVFDLFIVLTSWTLESISVLRTLRLRSFRIFRAFRLTTRIRALRRLVEAIFDVLPKITAIIIMFALILYVFGVMCTELFWDIDFEGRFPTEELAGNYDYFSRLDYSLFTLFAMVTLDWAKVTRAVMQVYPWAWAIFSTFVTFSSFVLYNLIIAVVCDAVKMVQDQQDILMVENYVKDKIESRHRIINLRQKLDKMSKQQMDLLLYVQLMLEQVEDIDDASKQHYEEALLKLGQTNENARDALQTAIARLDKFDRAVGKQKYDRGSGTRSQSASRRPAVSSADSSSYKKLPRRRRVSFQDANVKNIDDSENNDAMYEDAKDNQVAPYVMYDDDDDELPEIDESFHSCGPVPDKEDKKRGKDEKGSKRKARAKR